MLAALQRLLARSPTARLIPWPTLTPDEVNAVVQMELVHNIRRLAPSIRDLEICSDEYLRSQAEIRAKLVAWATELADNIRKNGLVWTRRGGYKGDLAACGSIYLCDDICGYEVKLIGVGLFANATDAELLDCCPSFYGLPSEVARDLYNAIAYSYSGVTS